jgi:hypothetical protein
MMTNAAVIQWMVMRRIRVRSSGGIGRRPVVRLRLERGRQYVRHPCRCQRSTVSGFTMSTEVRQQMNHRARVGRLGVRLLLS